MKVELPRTILGRTDLEITRFGIGGAYCESADGYRTALDCGVNYVDTARSYRDGEDEKVIGQAIASRRRDLILASKTGQRDAAGARRDLETSLRLLGTDYLDISNHPKEMVNLFPTLRKMCQSSSCSFSID